MALRSSIRMSPARLRLTALTVAPFFLALAVYVTTFAVLHDDLPDPLATHYDTSGAPNGYVGRSTVLFVGTGLLFLLGTVWTWCSVGRAAPTGRIGVWAMPAGGWGVAAFLGTVLTSMLHANAGPGDGSAARFPGWYLAVALGAAAVAAVLGALATRAIVGSVPPGRVPETPPGGTPDRIDLAANEVASWARGLAPWTMVLAGLLTLAGGVLAWVVTDWRVFAPLFLLGLAALLLASAYVTVDRRGLTVAPALLPWPAIRIPLSGITEVSSRRISPTTDFGGWGYRVRAHRTGLVTRSGDALVVRRRSGREFVVTVDDAATGAALLATLLDRRAGRTDRADREGR
ncbi:hypothetical protein GCM10010329_49060 [Streptomyces spiroverticillatus]|uniref:DUF1648 domain-containing protein n=1 Tax=Streptomyces finlayi TaxID=67296 RepID=A0A919CBZ5_9ACTN|nr:DUF1648 domain-containing protein [Streptomyces finlayi]GHA20080.1 hypothetical protein GCM10010329_49060 [Streptomyces spiroverticillatus]GHD02898.1 hypothetical protein GCM10010334_50010 [Streptomyces finlayi]